MDIHIVADKRALGAQAAAEGAEAIRAAIARDGNCTIILATGASQFEMLDALVIQKGIDWAKVTVFHLDEYVGLPSSHGASFRRYLKERFIARVPMLRDFVFIEGDAVDLDAEVSRLNNLITPRHVAVCFAGIGENCHLAFNDPPANFDVEAPYIVVALDEACRRQQLGEGWFPNLESVPNRAISMSICQILKSELIILCVPDARKAVAVKNAVEGAVSPDHPASVLQQHPHCSLYLDPPAAALLSYKAS
ncbi:glucosamine-6-phosphate deaminase [Microvirga sp. Mcv34]|uniref:glucosamine-6-phosphate deaminase n=1 Tax=Microvirga sp. Mcv34 TaxID=2926016 RepID=UPI0021C84629|nr:glucosamine-6-phosphate deaminase [Microvirga sp. Mcv34]